MPLWAGFGPSAAGGAGATLHSNGASGPPPPDDEGSEGGGLLEGFFVQVEGIKVGLWALRSLWWVGEN